MGSYIPAAPAEQREMLEAIGLRDFRELYRDVPESMYLDRPLDIPAGMSELEVGRALQAMAAKNQVFSTILRGAGAYDHYIPSIVKYIPAKEEFLTAYTPYQAEMSQGLLQSIFEYQTMICQLTGMDVSNASVYDGATAAAEAVTMMYGLRPRDKQKSGANVVFVDENIFPQTLAVMNTRAIPQGIELRVGRYQEFEPTQEVFACILQYPNSDGSIENYRSFTEKAHEADCKVAVAADLLSLALIVPPGEWGADIVFGTTQRSTGRMEFSGIMTHKS